jgi:diacylglycerol kinase (ATP)
LKDIGRDAAERIRNATIYSLQGLRATFRNEQAFRQELYLVAVLTPLGLWFGEDGVERALLIGSLLLVLIVELVNSGVESAVDRFGEQRHELSGRAKDAGSAAVFLSLLNVVVIWALVLLG